MRPAAKLAEDESACARELDSDLGWGLGIVFRSYVKAATSAFAELPGGPRGYQVLKSAARDLPASQVALAQQLGVDRTVMTYLLDDLVAAGLVERRADPADRRARRIVATERGHSQLTQLDERLRLADEHVLGVLNADEASAFRRLLQRLAMHADNVDHVVNPCQVVDELDRAAGVAT